MQEPGNSMVRVVSMFRKFAIIMTLITALVVQFAAKNAVDALPPTGDWAICVAMWLKVFASWAISSLPSPGTRCDRSPSATRRAASVIRAIGRLIVDASALATATLIRNAITAAMDRRGASSRHADRTSLDGVARTIWYLDGDASIRAMSVEVRDRSGPGAPRPLPGI